MLRPQSVFLDAVPQRVARDPELRRRAREVPAGGVQHREERLPLVFRLLAARPSRRIAPPADWLGQFQQLGGHLVGFAQKRHAFHQVGQFADVPRPRVCEEGLLRRRADPAARQAVVLTRASEIVLGQLQHVAAPIAQRRQTQGHRRHPMVEIGPETLLLHRRRQILVRGAEDPDVHRLRSRAAEAPHLPLLQRREELRLHRERERADLVEEQHAAVRSLKESRLALTRIGERAALHAEQLGFDEVLRDRGAVDLDPRPLAPPAGAMDGAREEPLAHAGLALDQERREPP